tara:strand:+ start:10535 stop:10993 length:459 start_codon:yes stop_codon:yes gene_type:complete
MKVGKAIKKIEKYLGVEVQYDGCRYWFAYEGEIGSFLANGHRGGMDADAMEANACNWHRRRSNDHSDLMTDYHAGSFRDNLTQLLHSMKPPPCKFKTGQLVRGKDTKRASRWGFAGLTGMVTKEASDSVNVQWLGTDRTDSYIATRDLELVS